MRTALAAEVNGRLAVLAIGSLLTLFCSSMTGCLFVALVCLCSIVIMSAIDLLAATLRLNLLSVVRTWVRAWGPLPLSLGLVRSLWCSVRSLGRSCVVTLAADATRLVR